jgi:hypothetical protein
LKPKQLKMLRWLRTKKSSEDFLAFISLSIERNSFKYRVHVEIFVYFYLASAIVTSIMFLKDSKSLRDFSATLEMLPAFIGILIRLTNLMINRRKFEELLEKVSNLMKFEDWLKQFNGEKLQTRVSKSEKYLKITFVVFGFGLTMNLLSSLLSHQLPFKMWFPFDYQHNEALFILSAAYQLLLCIILVPVEVFTEGFPIFMICYVTGMLEELSEVVSSIESTKNPSQSDKSTKELVKCIKVQ